MKTTEKEKKIRRLSAEMLNESHKEALKKLDRVFSYGAIDTEAWDENIDKMILPKAIVTSILESEAYQYAGKGTSFEKRVKKEVRNLRNYI